MANENESVEQALFRQNVEALKSDFAALSDADRLAAMTALGQVEKEHAAKREAQARDADRDYSKKLGSMTNDDLRSEYAKLGLSSPV